MPRDIRIEQCTALPQKDALNPILKAYYVTIVERMEDIGITVDPAAPASALAEFWDNAGDYLPPQGCLVLARDMDQDRIIGCGMLKRFDATTGELKRVFVLPEARGTGTGRALIATREAAAREMGLTRLVADTLTANVEMRSVYPKMGFQQVKGPIETQTYRDQPMLRPHMIYFSKDL